MWSLPTKQPTLQLAFVLRVFMSQVEQSFENLVIAGNKTPAIVSVDVECVANGPGHLDRTPCRIAIVNENLKVLMDDIVFVDTKKIVDDMSAVHGLTAEDLKKGMSLETALLKVWDILIKLQKEKGVILVGAGIQHDIEWCQLKQNVHFKECVNINEKFTHEKKIPSLR